jgi:hypothetical protein
MLASSIAAVFVVLWSTGFVVARAITPYADPNLFLLARFGGTALIFTLAALATRAAWPTGRDLGKHLLAGALLQGVYLGAGYWAVAQGLSAGVMALLGALQPLATAAVAAPLFGERLSRRGRRRAGPRTETRRGRAGHPAWRRAAVAGRVHFDRRGRRDHRGHAVSEDFAGEGRYPQRKCGAEFRRGGGCGDSCAGARRASLDYIGHFVGVACVGHRDAARATVLLFLAPPLAALEGYVGFGETLLPVQIAGFAVALVGVLLARS